MIEVSGVTKIHRHSNTVKAIESSAQVLLAPNEIQQYPDSSDRSISEEEAVDRLLDATGANYWILVPLKTLSSRDGIKQSESHSENLKTRDSTFALLCEKFEGEPFPPAISSNANLWSNCSIALDNWKYLQSIPAATAQASLTRILGAHIFVKILSLLLLLAASPLLLKSISMQHWVESYGKLNQAHSKNLYASSSATVMNIHVVHGQIVEAGQVLLELESSQILQLQRDLMGQLQVNQEQLLALKSRQLSNIADSAYQANLSGAGKSNLRDGSDSDSSDVLQLESTIANLEAQLELVDSDIKKLKIISPFKARIATWDVHNRLYQRPVKIGDWLLTLEPIDEVEWQVELEVSPVGMGALNEALAKATNAQVKFRLNSAPEKEFDAQITDISNVAQASERYGAAINAKAEVLSHEDSTFQSGTELRALIDCGRKSVWDVWTFEIRHWWNYRIRPTVAPFVSHAIILNPGSWR